MTKAFWGGPDTSQSCRLPSQQTQNRCSRNTNGGTAIESLPLRNTRHTASSDTPKAYASVPPPQAATPGRSQLLQLPQNTLLQVRRVGRRLAGAGRDPKARQALPPQIACATSPPYPHATPSSAAMSSLRLTARQPSTIRARSTRRASSVRALV